MSEVRGWPVEWKGKTYTLSPLTAGVKEQYCRWVGAQMVRKAREDFEADDARAVREDVAAGRVWWGATVASSPVVVSFKTTAGQAALVGLLLGSHGPTPAELEELVAAKGEDSDLGIALGLAMSAQGPKAQRGVPATTTPAGTPNSGETSAAAGSGSPPETPTT